jgi:hypothetical protein
LQIKEDAAWKQAASSLRVPINLRVATTAIDVDGGKYDDCANWQCIDETKADRKFC